jgi:hypothetical protein
VEEMQLDLTTVAAIWMGGLVLLVPLIGLTLRFGFVPFLESLARVRAAWARDPASVDTAERLGDVEARLGELCRDVERLAEREAATY